MKKRSNMNLSKFYLKLNFLKIESFIINRTNDLIKGITYFTYNNNLKKLGTMHS